MAERNTETQEMNIQPQAGVIGVFSRLNYKPWYAIAEFVDNSTQSFYSHQAQLKKNGINMLDVNIDYDEEHDILTIADNAYGMEMEDFQRAVKIDSPPENKDGRNEFGMGLKTAASWFGNVWSVKTTQLGSPYEYYTEVNIPKIRTELLNSVPILITKVSTNTHGTTITIKDITKKIGPSRTKAKIVDLLKSMYRRDLDSGVIHINYNGEPLYFEEYTNLSFRNQVWRKNIDFDFIFDRKKHHIKGFVGILANGGFGRAGFALFRRNRVVIGGEDQNYKPEEIFGQAQSTISHKLYGEIDLDDFPVNQAKDGFIWDDGLEEAFIQKLKENINEYINIAKKTNKERIQEESLSKKVSDDVHSNIQNIIDKAGIALAGEINSNIFDNENRTLDNNELNGEEQTSVELFIKYQEEQNNQPEVEDEKIREYKISVDAVHTIKVSVQWTLGNSSTWIKVDQNEDNNSAFVKLNINHPFFKPFSEKQDFKEVLEKFAIAFALAELRAKQNANSDGSISPNAFRNYINIYLKELND